MAYHREAANLRAWLKAGARITWDSHHANYRVQTRDVPKFLAERIINTGAVTRVSIEVTGEERWTMSGHDPDGRPIDVVIEATSASVAVITVIRKD